MKLNQLNINRLYTLTSILFLLPFIIVIISYFPKPVPEKAIFLFEENGLYESLTSFFSFLASAISLLLFKKTRYIGFLLMSFLAFVFAMEEISWGYHLFGNLIDYSSFISVHNNQAEPNLHNFVILERFDMRDLLSYLLSTLFALSLYFRDRYISQGYSLLLLLITNSLAFFIFISIISVITSISIPSLSNTGPIIDYWYSFTDEVIEFQIAFTFFIACVHKLHHPLKIM